MHRVFMISYIEVSRREKQRGSGVPIKEQHLNCSKYERCRSQWPRVLRRWSAAARLLRLWVRIPPEEWMSVCCVMFCLCDELITRQEESYRLWCVVVCDLETSWMGRTWPTEGCCAKRKKEQWILRTQVQFLGRNILLNFSRTEPLRVLKYCLFMALHDDSTVSDYMAPNKGWVWKTNCKKTQKKSSLSN